MKKTQVARLLAYVTGRMNQQLLRQTEYLLAENRILRTRCSAHLVVTSAGPGSDLQAAVESAFTELWGQRHRPAVLSVTETPN